MTDFLEIISDDIRLKFPFGCDSTPSCPGVTRASIPKFWGTGSEGSVTTGSQIGSWFRSVYIYISSSIPSWSVSISRLYSCVSLPTSWGIRDERGLTAIVKKESLVNPFCSDRLRSDSECVHDIILNKGSLGNYLKDNCQSELYQQLAFVNRGDSPLL